MLSRANYPGLLLAALFLVVPSLASVPRAQAGESGMTGYEVCAISATHGGKYVLTGWTYR